MVGSNTPAPELPGVRHSDALILYGVKLNAAKDHAAFSVGPGNRYLLYSQLYEYIPGPGKGYVAKTKDEYSVALVYAYAFDGHCYRNDTLRTLIVIGPADEPAIGCGFDPPEGVNPKDNPYRMWRIRASTEMLEIVTNYGDAKALVLDANLPGKRSPSSYAITHSMGHRSGRLSQD